MLLAWTTNIALQAERMRSEKSNVGREGQQHIVNKLQWPKIKLGNNIAYSHKDWQKKNTANITITYSFVPLFTIFLVGIYVIDLKSIFYWLAAPVGLRSWDLKINKSWICEFVLSSTGTLLSVALASQSQRRSWRWDIKFGWKRWFKSGSNKFRRINWRWNCRNSSLW